MPRRFVNLYRHKRVVNINVNITAAGLLAIALTEIPVHLLAEPLREHHLALTLIAGAFDAAFDVAIYYILHWVANHWGHAPKTAREGVPNRAFFRDASLVQFERAILSPLYYIVALGLKFSLLRMGLAPEAALAIGFVSAILVTRVLHTIWGVRSGRFRDHHEPAESNPDAAEAGVIEPAAEARDTDRRVAG